MLGHLKRRVSGLGVQGSGVEGAVWSPCDKVDTKTVLKVTGKSRGLIFRDLKFGSCTPGQIQKPWILSRILQPWEARLPTDLFGSFRKSRDPNPDPDSRALVLRTSTKRNPPIYRNSHVAVISISTLNLPYSNLKPLQGALNPFKRYKKDISNL